MSLTRSVIPAFLLLVDVKPAFLYPVVFFNGFQGIGADILAHDFAGHSLKQVDGKLSSMILSNCHVKVALNCGAEDAELMAREIGINPQEIQKLKPFEAYIGIGKKPHKVLTFPGPQIQPYQAEPVVKPKEIDFLWDGWIEL
ncbi:hypothetical protein LLG96_04230 [bacterium]|nr:hypothetical protein [bacterium]